MYLDSVNPMSVFLPSNFLLFLAVHIVQKIAAIKLFVSPWNLSGIMFSGVHSGISYQTEILSRVSLICVHLKNICVLSSSS